MTGSESGAMICWIGAIALAFTASQVFKPQPAGAEDSRSPNPAATVIEAKKKCFKNDVQVTGVVVPTKEIALRPEEDGQISDVPEKIRLGATVNKDDVLARLKPIQLGVPPGAPMVKPSEGPSKPPEPQNKEIVVKAPTAGILTSKAPVVGTMARAKDGPPLFQIAEDGQLELLADVPLETLQKLAAANKQAPAQIAIAGLSDRKLAGKVRLISATVNMMTQLGQVYVTMEKDSRVLIGAFARAMVQLEERCRPAVPISALLFTPQKDFQEREFLQDRNVVHAVVQVVLRDGLVQGKDVTVGLFDETQAEIVFGLEEGEIVIAKTGFFRSGDYVRAIAASQSSTRR
jgi:multidrug efflux pump subunit AcrA (membrane-fusion protein)